MVNVELPGEAGRGEAILDAQFAARAVAIGINRGLRHAQLAGDLFGRQVLVDEAQAVAFALREQPHRICDDLNSCAHDSPSKPRLRALVYFNACII